MSKIINFDCSKNLFLESSTLQRFVRNLALRAGLGARTNRGGVPAVCAAPGGGAFPRSAQLPQLRGGTAAGVCRLGRARRRLCAGEARVARLVGAETNHAARCEGARGDSRAGGWWCGGYGCDCEEHRDGALGGDQFADWPRRRLRRVGELLISILVYIQKCIILIFFFFFGFRMILRFTMLLCLRLARLKPNLVKRFTLVLNSMFKKK